jgi:trehalose 6-phosphate synthase
MALKREPASPGPVAELFDRLHHLHLRAGEPGVRQIANGIGRGVISYTTVHNVFRGPRVPRWGYLELIVEQLNGDVEAFRQLWMAARQEELENPVRSSGENLTPVSPEDREPISASSVPVAGAGHDFVIVMHRLPSHAGTTGERRDSVPVGLSNLAQSIDGVLVGWPGGQSAPEGRTEKFTKQVVELSAQEVIEHYEGYCNSTIWPLYHDAIERPIFRSDWHEAYRTVNRRFANAAAVVASLDASVWVHDYQLQLVPEMLRKQRPDLEIGFFLHIPFPPIELFQRLPGRAEILRGLLGAHLIGFQQPIAADNFLRMTRQILDLRPGPDSVTIDGRRVQVGAFPVSINFGENEVLANDVRVRRRAAQLRSELGNPEVLLAGIDRFDYTKGIEERLKAYGDLLGDGGLSPSRSVFVQFAMPSREGNISYRELRERVDQLAGRLNGTYGRMGRQVVHYAYRTHDTMEVMALNLAADVMVVTPFRDGMNLAAKEYVASRVDNRGVLVLSEFAGAAAELPQAILVNPYDLDGLKAALRRAVTMDPAQQRQRMRVMRQHIRTHDFAHWHETFLASLERAVQIR